MTKIAQKYLNELSEAYDSYEEALHDLQGMAKMYQKEAEDIEDEDEAEFYAELASELEDYIDKLEDAHETIFSSVEDAA